LWRVHVCVGCLVFLVLVLVLSHSYAPTRHNSWKQHNNWGNDSKLISEWHGVQSATTNATAVLSIDLHFNGLRGCLPPSLGRLASMAKLCLSCNNLTGNHELMQIESIR